MKKPKSLETKLRSAIRLIWSRSSERAQVKKASIFPDPELGKAFICPHCGKKLHEKMGEVDHVTPVGKLENWRDVEGFIDRMFFSPQEFICTICHKLKTKKDVKEMRRKK
jgi:5-methylcytosine-specific restriction endonuclease McrA